MKFDIIVDNYQTYLAAPVHCSRCQRSFLAGQRARMVVSGPVDRTLHQRYALLNQRLSQQYWEYENPDHCTEAR